MSATIDNFIEKQNIDLKKIAQLREKVVLSAKDINPIIYENRISKPDEVLKKVSIADILGYRYSHLKREFEYDGGNSIENDSIENYYGVYEYHCNNFMLMSNFFDEKGDGYKIRSLSMLDYSTEEVMDKLADSFKSEPLRLEEADEGKYVIGGNGLHRYNVLKAHYLKELSMLDKDDEKGRQALREKYTIEAYVYEIDYTKTYTASILKIIQPYQDIKFDLYLDRDENWNFTGNTVVQSVGDIKAKKVMTDEQLVQFLDNQISEFVEEYGNDFNVMDDIDYNLSKLQSYESFKKYYHKWIENPELYNSNDKKLIEQNKEKGNMELQWK